MSGDTSNRHLIEELEQYRRLLDNIPAEIGVFDPDGRFLFNTPSGIPDAKTREWVLGKTHHDFCRERDYPTEIADRRQSVIDRCVRQKQPITFEELWIDKQGQRKYYARTFSPVLDAGATVTHVIGYGQEITDLKKSEEALRVAHDELEEEVEVRREAESQLRQALKEVQVLREQLRAENAYLQEEIQAHHNFNEIIGESAGIKNVLEAIETVAPTGANVVVYGETGTGKELVARAVHALSERRDKPLIKVNCATIPKDLFESEFFGHVRGAFTGAVKDRAGRFELANGGTLFLDEVGEIPLDMQSKLLRVLQEGEYERVGEETTCKVDVRIIAATNRDLKQEVAEGRFRQDLYYRLTVFPLEVPPLRRRKEDIPLIASHFLELTARKLGRRVPGLTESCGRQLRDYAWPGNVRELQNVIERAAIISRGDELLLDLPEASDEGLREPNGGSSMRSEQSAEVIRDDDVQRWLRKNLLNALARTDWRIYGPQGAAALLGLKPTTLASRIKRMGLEKPDPPS